MYTILQYHGGNLSKALLELFPEINLDKTKFWTRGIFILLFYLINLSFVYTLLQFLGVTREQDEDSLRNTLKKIILIHLIPMNGTNTKTKS